MLYSQVFLSGSFLSFCHSIAIECRMPCMFLHKSMAMVILYPVPLCPFKHASMFKVFRFFPCQFFCDKLSISLKADLNTAEVFLSDSIGFDTFRVSAL
jgi:hypothetical protein